LQARSTGWIRSSKVSPISIFFRRTSAELCAAIFQPSEPAAALLRDYIAQIDDHRLKRAFEAAIEEDDQPKAPAVSKAEVPAVSRPVEQRDGL
jgi:hypothetical protein